MSSNNSSLASEALKNISNELPNVASIEDISSNPAVIFTLATTLLFIYIGIVLTVGFPVNQGDEASNDGCNNFLLIDDDDKYYDETQQTTEESENNQSKENEKEEKENSDEN
ncbi:hypothetical protein PGO_127200 [Plasmodium gonderi]|uniref:Uncharacterized protein n=1 Tax=Plasmodium gonderi TaxID=77519 RepID=A0A1Y1JPH1_PLAGO|nr:hypothetical protein PGO_127200 [Plasmodium gonderi]GAW82722.1 hypothetical protein PGO_127200 [Plasmodium gonderi]